MITNAVSACIQFFGLRQMFKRLPVGNVLLMMPCAVSLLALGALTSFRLQTVAGAFMAFKILEYSVYVASKEMIFIPLSFEARHVAKEYIDVVAYRLGKGGMNAVLSALQILVLGASFSAYQLEALSFVCSSVWFSAAYKLRAAIVAEAGEKGKKE
jgi:ATP/ADP translocase